MAMDHLKSPPQARRGRRRRPSLDDLLRNHSAELALGVGLAPDEALEDDDLVGLKALFDLVGSGAEHLLQSHLNPFLEKLGVFMAGERLGELYSLHQMQLSPAEAEALEEAGKKAEGCGVMDVKGFGKLLEMVVTSGDGEGLAGGLGDASRPNHAMSAEDVKKSRRGPEAGASMGLQRVERSHRLSRDPPPPDERPSKRAGHPGAPRVPPRIRFWSSSDDPRPGAGGPRPGPWCFPPP